MRLVIHDYAGHPFQLQLSEELARRGHQVSHLYFGGDSGPKAGFEAAAARTPSLQVQAVRLDRPYDKRKFLQRRFLDIEYGKRVGAILRDLKPDLVISGNTPTEAQASVLRAAHGAGSAFIYWLQDFYGVAVDKLLAKRWLGAGRLIGGYYKFLERRQLTASEAVVAITEDFRPLLEQWGIADDRITVIENWAPLDEVVPMAKANPWAVEQGLSDKFVFLYSGTLGLKHDPALLSRLAERVAGRSDTRVVVISEGVGADWLRKEKAARGLNNLVLLPFQPFSRFSEVLGAGDVTIALIEPDAGIFSVPSKVLSYLSAGKPMLLSVPGANLAAKTVEKVGAGLAASPGDAEAFLQAAEQLMSDAAQREAFARRGRAYALDAFAIGGVADRFEAAFSAAIQRARRRPT